MENPNKNVTGKDSNNIGNVQNNNIQNSAYERISDICNSIIADERLYGMDELVYKTADIKYLRCPSSNVNFFKFHNTFTLHKL